MNKPRVSYEQAVRLKATGYDVPTRECYRSSDITGKWDRPNNWNGIESISKPTLDDVCRWLREVHGLHCAFTMANSVKWAWFMQDTKDCGKPLKNMELSDTHDSAQSAAIDASLTIIEERKKTQQ